MLLYHHVGPQHPGQSSGLTVSPERFEKHVRYLASRGYKGICPADWLRWRREGKGLPEKPILFTFDDAYADLAEYALPVLHRYGFGAGVYVVTGQLGGTNAWDEARGCGTLHLMTADQIRQWASKGIEFGAHSRTHANLPTLAPAELTEEVVGSGNDLESIIGSHVVSFAYPYGFHNQAVDDCVRSAFDLAFIADDWDEGMNHLQTDPHLSCCAPWCRPTIPCSLSHSAPGSDTTRSLSSGIGSASELPFVRASNELCISRPATPKHKFAPPLLCFYKHD